MDESDPASYTVFCENTQDKHSINSIRRLSGGDYGKRFIIGEPQPTATMTVEELKTKRLVGIYQIITEVRYR
jgi:hypothetical protein